jgi:UDP-N-acetylglucosamine 3-dehydrogenase
MSRVGVIGLGMMGRNHLRVLRDMEDAQICAVCDRDPELLAKATSAHSVPGYSSWDEMLERERLDAVVIALPTRHHCAAGLAALSHGLHVLVEKPIAASLDEGRLLVAAAARYGRKLAVGHIERFNPAVRQLQARLEAGEVGRIFQLQARRLGPFPARIRDVGVVVDLATHDLDVIEHLAGCPVQRIYAETEQRIHTDHEDMLNALLRFSSGVLGVVQVNWLTPTKIRELTVLGEKGMFICNYLTQDLTYFKNADVLPVAEARRRPRAVKEGEAVMFPIPEGEPLKIELKAFLDAIRDDREIEVGGEAGLRALHLALAVVEAASGSRVLEGPELARLWRGVSSDSEPVPGSWPHSA